MIIRLANDVAVQTDRIIDIIESAGNAVVSLDSGGTSPDTVTVTGQSADEVIEKIEAAQARQLGITNGNRN